MAQYRGIEAASPLTGVCSYWSDGDKRTHRWRGVAVAALIILVDRLLPTLVSAQSPGRKQNIVVILGDDIAMWNVDAHSAAVKGPDAAEQRLPASKEPRGRPRRELRRFEIVQLRNITVRAPSRRPGS